MLYGAYPTLDFSIEDITRRIRSDVHFAFARCGDGEWKAILRHPGSNCDDHPYYRDLGKALEKVVADPDIYVGIHSGPRLKDEISAYLDVHGLKRDWVKNEILQDGWKKGDDHELYDTLKAEDVVLVANEDIEFPGADKIEIPKKDCWQHYTQIVMDCEKKIGEGKVFLIAAGMPGAVMVSELWATFKQCTFIDIGTWLDGWNNVASRSWIRKNL